MAMNMVWGIESEEDYMDYIDIDLSDEVIPQDLFPGLPEEIAMECLLRVAPTAFPQLQSVCKRWSELVPTEAFFEARKRAGVTQKCVCIVQTLPEEEQAEEIQTSGGEGLAGGGGAQHQLQGSTSGGSGGGATGKQQQQQQHRQQHHHQSAPKFGLSIYDAGNWTWSRLPMIPDFAEDGLPVFCRVVGLRGKLVLIGGWHPATYEALRRVYMFDFCTRMWKRCADMPVTRSFFACGAVAGRVFVAGGHDDNKNGLASADVYFPEEDRWEALPDMSEERDECVGGVVDGKLMAVVSGYSTTAQGQFVSSGDLYDPSTGRWQRVEGMWVAGMNPSPLASSADGHLYAVQKQNLMRYCSGRNEWAVVDSLPFEQGDEDRVATWATVISDSVILMTLPDTEEATGRPIIHRRSMGGEENIGKWELVQTDDAFCRLGRAACGVEI